MSLLLDAYNICHVTGVLPPELAGIDVPQLRELILRSRYRQRRAVLVCDGTSHPEVRSGTEGRITVRFAGVGRTADDVIEQLIAQSSTPRRLLVVSSDHQVLRAGRRRKCKVLKSESFLQQLVRDVQHALHEIPRRASSQPRSIAKASTMPSNEQWLRLFNIDEDRVEREARDLLPKKSPQAVQEAGTAPTKAATFLKQPGTGSSRSPGPKTDNKPQRVRKQRIGQGSNPVLSTLKDEPAPVLPADIVAQAEQLEREAQSFNKSGSHFGNGSTRANSGARKR